MTAAVIASPGTVACAEQGSEATASPHPQRVGPRDRQGAGEIVASLPLLPVWSRSPGRNAQRLRGARRILDWLSGFPGDGWQARWLLSGADNGTGWIDEAAAGTGDIPAIRREVVTDGFAVLLLLQVVLPGYQLLARYRTTSLFREARRVFSPGLFERIGQAGRKTGHSAVQQAVAEDCLLKMMLHTGRDLGELTEDDLIGYHDWGRRNGGEVPPGLHAAWDLLRDAGVLTTGLPLRRAVGRGQLTASQLVDRYQIQCRPARDAFVAYLDERRPGLDYSSLQGLASRLVGTFWADIEQHHPGIGSLRLPAQVAEDWKRRLAFRIDRKGNQVARTNRLGVLVSVRAFYLDIALWALEDPSWVRWAVPSPVRQSDLSGFAKEKKQVQARMHQRIRERLPRLPDLLAAAESHHADQKELLAATEAAAIGQAFEHAGRRYRRISRSEDRAPRRLQYRQSMILPKTWTAASSTTSRTARTRHSGPWPSSKRSAIPASGSKNCRRSRTWRWCPTSSPTPAKSSPCCRSSRPRATRRGCCWSALSWPASWPPSSAGCEATTPAWSRWSPVTTPASTSPGRRCRTCSSAASAGSTT